MNGENEPIQALEDIKKMMDRSSRFVSLSGWSGIAAGICALIAAWIASKKLDQYGINNSNPYETNATYSREGSPINLDNELLVLALITFVAAFHIMNRYKYSMHNETCSAIFVICKFLNSNHFYGHYTSRRR